MKKRWVKGQNLAEIVVLLALVGLAFMGMQKYIQRGVQRRAKVLTDKIIGGGQSPYTVEQSHSKSETESKDKIKVTTSPGGSVNKEILQGKINTHSDSWSMDKKGKGRLATDNEVINTDD